MIKTRQVQQRFSTSARSYDAGSSLHREIADGLLAALTVQDPPAILDVGCGTGYLTGRLKVRFPNARIVGLDFAPGMLKAASAAYQGIDWVLADSHHLPLSDKSVGAVVSNLAYQWSRDLTLAFQEARRVLKPGGVLSCTLFGYATCQELFHALQLATPLQLSRLPDIAQVRHALSLSGFTHAEANSTEAARSFEDMPALLAWLKSIGANNLRRQGYLGRQALSRAASVYREKFSLAQGVAATFEVVSVYAQK